MKAAASLPRIRRFFSERPRPIAAILTGFSHNTGNLAQSRENPFPSPRASPAPSGISPALPWRRAAASLPPARRDLRADSGSVELAVARRLVRDLEGAATRLTLWEHVCGEGTFPTAGLPLIRVYKRGGCVPSSRRGNRSQNRSELGGGRAAAG